MKDFFWHAERPFALLQTDAIGDLQIARGKLRTDKPSKTTRQTHWQLHEPQGTSLGRPWSLSIQVYSR